MIIRDFEICIIPNSTIQRIINANQYDKGEVWRFTLYDENGIKIVPTDASIIGIKPDNKIIALAGTIDENGRVCITETEQMTAAIGISKYEITFDGGTHGTYNFNVYVEEKPGADGIVSDSEIAIFQQAISEAAAAVKTSTEQAALSKKYAGEAKTTADALAADTTTIKNGISQIATDVQKLNTDLTKFKEDTTKNKTATESTISELQKKDGEILGKMGTKQNGKVIKASNTIAQDLKALDDAVGATQSQPNGSVYYEYIGTLMPGTVRITIPKGKKEILATYISTGPSYAVKSSLIISVPNKGYYDFWVGGNGQASDHFFRFYNGADNGNDYVLQNSILTAADKIDIYVK